MTGRCDYDVGRPISATLRHSASSQSPPHTARLKYKDRDDNLKGTSSGRYLKASSLNGPEKMYVVLLRWWQMAISAASRPLHAATTTKFEDKEDDYWKEFGFGSCHKDSSPLTDPLRALVETEGDFKRNVG